MPHAETAAVIGHNQPPAAPLPPRRLTVREIATAVSAVSQVPLEVMFSPCRHPYTVLARWVVMRIASGHGRTLKEIGRILNRDHTTVLHGLQTSQRLGNYAPERARMLAAIESEACERLAVREVLRPYQPPPSPAEQATAAANARLLLTRHQLHKAWQLRRRGWSVAGISRYLELPQDVVKLAIGRRAP